MLLLFLVTWNSNKIQNKLGRKDYKKGKESGLRRAGARVKLGWSSVE